MKHLAKAALGAVMMVGAAVGTTAATTAPASAGVSVGVGIGLPGPVVAPAPYPSCYNYDYWAPGCAYPAYSGPVWIGGAWYNGPHYYRYWGGHPYVWWHGGWRGYRGGWGGWRGAAWHGGWRRWTARSPTHLTCVSRPRRFSAGAGAFLQPGTIGQAQSPGMFSRALQHAIIEPRLRFPRTERSANQ